jgi:hypothetical protein
MLASQSVVQFRLRPPNSYALHRAGHYLLIGRDLIFQNTSKHPGSFLMNI